MLAATSATVVALRLRGDGGGQELYLRLFTLAEWLETEPDLAPHEAAALARAARCRPATPELVAVDGDGGHCGVPAILMSRVPGRLNLLPRDFDEWLVALAEALVEIHDVSGDDFGWTYRCWHSADLRAPSWSRDPSLWERGLERWHAGQPEEPATFIHRDYHPTNVLWESERLSGVVDWVNACAGPRGADLSHCRGNLMRMYGLEAADRFLAAYLERAPGVVYHPFWDLDLLLGCLPEPRLYPPWEDLGLRGLRPQDVGTRADTLLERTLALLGP